MSKYQLRLVCQGGLRRGDHTPENQMLWRPQRQESLCGAGHHCPLAQGSFVVAALLKAVGHHLWEASVVKGRDEFPVSS